MVTAKTPDRFPVDAGQDGSWTFGAPASAVDLTVALPTQQNITLGSVITCVATLTPASNTTISDLKATFTGTLTGLLANEGWVVYFSSDPSMDNSTPTYQITTPQAFSTVSAQTFYCQVSGGNTAGPGGTLTIDIGTNTVSYTKSVTTTLTSVSALSGAKKCIIQET